MIWMSGLLYAMDIINLPILRLSMHIRSKYISFYFIHKYFSASTPSGMSGSSSRDNGYSHSASKRKQSSQSTPSSPTRLRKAQCTCAHDPSMQQLQQLQQQHQAQSSRGNLKGKRHSMLSDIG